MPILESAAASVSAEKPALAIGQQWRTRAGEIAHVTSCESDDEPYPWIGHVDGEQVSWTEDGRVLRIDESDDDLVELIAAAPAAASVAAHNDLAGLGDPEEGTHLAELRHIAAEASRTETASRVLTALIAAGGWEAANKDPRAPAEPFGENPATHADVLADRAVGYADALIARLAVKP
jgi:hypothetical protein